VGCGLKMFGKAEYPGTDNGPSKRSGASGIAQCNRVARESYMCRLRFVPTEIGVVCLASEIADIENGNFS
jgi:hypothetical protein